jgi:hypothetical protein
VCTEFTASVRYEKIVFFRSFLETSGSSTKLKEEDKPISKKYTPSDNETAIGGFHHAVVQ